MENYQTDTNHPVVLGASAQDEELPTMRFLTARQVAMIDEALSSLGEFGELRLVVERGRLRFLVTHQSFDALKWHPGGIKKSKMEQG